MKIPAALLAASLSATFAGGAAAQTAPKTMPQDSAGTTGTPPAPAMAAQPQHGANSFTRAQAARRIASRGFRDVSDLIRDDNGVWHGTATRDGHPVKVWEDYRGRVGTE